MLKALANKALGVLGYRLVRRSPGRRSRRFKDRPDALPLVAAIRRDPADATAHAAYGALAARHRKHHLAHAQARTAQFLQPAQAAFEDSVRVTAAALPPVLELGHNTYHRMQALARILRDNGHRPGSSVLDVGGGHGELAAFLPGSPYLLADPAGNGLDATVLPAGLGPFDYVVSCHVLEHVEPAQRDGFLDALVGRMRGAVVLLNPFHVAGASEQERLRLVIDLTDADWAREHLECSLPHLRDVRDYAARNGLTCQIEPVGALTTTMAYVFLEHFARRADMAAELKRIDAFFNERLCDAELSEPFPTGFAVVLKRDNGP